MKISLFASLLSIATVSIAGVIPDQQRDLMIQNALNGFWGHAKNSRGELIQPSSETERKTVPITTSIAYRALDAGEISGLAEWCGLEWKEHYLALTKAARAQQFSDKQVAFVSFLHGMAQGTVSNAMKTKVCGDKERTQAQIWLNQSKVKGLYSS